MKNADSWSVACKAGLPALAVLFLAGCLTAGPDYKQPALVTPARWNPAGEGAFKVGPLDPAALSRWWSVFDDPVLSNLVENAQRSNLDLKQAEARLRQARAQRQLAQADRRPAASVDASVGRSRSSENLGSGKTSTRYASRLDASWEADLFGGKRRAAESAEASLQASQEARNDVMVSLLAEVALNYVQVRSCQVRLEIVATNLASQAETYDIARWRQQASLVTQVDVDQARVSLEQTRAALPVLRTSLDQAEHQLAVLLGGTPGSLKALLETQAPRVPVAVSELAPGIPADVLRQRPDVRRAERNLAAQTAQIGMAEAARYPDLTLSGLIGFEALSAGDLYTAGSRTVQGLVNAGVTLFDGGRLRQKVNVQTALQEEALAAYEAAVLAALKDVEDALVAYANETARQRALQAAAAAAGSAFKLASDQYASGLVDFPTVLGTQQSLLVVQSTLASSQADATSDLIRLYKALGGGWTTTK
jgi:NodT family efflux transporter outer membrane factor (OMF) lipoprotein